MNVLVIANPIAGGGRGHIAGEALAHALSARGVAVDLFETRAAGDAERAARESSADCVSAVGGDGTAGEVANGIAGTDRFLALLPLGTANVLARTLALPRNPAQLADTIVSGKTRLIDTALAGERRFLQSAGAGVDAALVAAVHASRGRRLGLRGYVLPGLRLLRTYRYPKVRVRVDGRTLCDAAEYVVAGNCPWSAGIFRFTPDSCIDDGKLDVCAFCGVTLPRLMRWAAASFRPDFARRKDIIYGRGECIEYEALEDSPVHLQLDGDPAGMLPATLHVDPKSLRVLRV